MISSLPDFDAAIVADRAWFGHMPLFHREICLGFLKLGLNVVSVTPEPESLSEWSASLPCEYASKIRFALWREPPSQKGKRLPEKAIALWRQALSIGASQLVGQHRSALLYIPFLDYGFAPPLLSPITLDDAIPCRWAGLLIAPRPLNRAAWFARKKTRAPFPPILHSERCLGVHLLNEDLTTDNTAGARLLPFPDFTDNAAADASPFVRSLDPSRPLVLYAGNGSNRKGLDWFIESARYAARRGKNWQFVVAGEFSLRSSGSKRAYRRNWRGMASASNLHCMPFRLPEADFNAIVSRADVLWGVYRDFPGSSNIMAKAAVFRKPILCSNRFLMGQRTRAYRLGAVVAEGDVPAIHDALLGLLRWPSDSRRELESGAANYLAAHNVAAIPSALGRLFHADG